MLATIMAKENSGPTKENQKGTRPDVGNFAGDTRFDLGSRRLGGGHFGVAGQLDRGGFGSGVLGGGSPGFDVGNRHMGHVQPGDLGGRGRAI